jgi:hypothetical protein
MQTPFTAQSATTNAVVRGQFTATPIADDLSWGVGAIQPNAAYAGPAEQRKLLEVVLESLATVNDAELPYSSCTDGRVPIRLQNGEAVPVREQLVGADTMLVFHMAEVLGPRFYKDPAAALADRLKEVASFLQANGLTPCTHISCGAAGSYVAIVQNLVNFATDERFIARQKTLLPEGIYDDDLRQQIAEGYKTRLASDAYKDWSDQLVLDTVQAGSDRTVAELNDDGRGVHGHVEEQIIRIRPERTAINEAQVIARTAGREVFGVSDARMYHLAELMGRGHDEDYRLALMAAEDFTDGGHGTLAKDLPTYVVTLA